MSGKLHAFVLTMHYLFLRRVHNSSLRNGALFESFVIGCKKVDLADMVLTLLLSWFLSTRDEPGSFHATFLGVPRRGSQQCCRLKTDLDLFTMSRAARSHAKLHVVGNRVFGDWRTCRVETAAVFQCQCYQAHAAPTSSNYSTLSAANHAGLTRSCPRPVRKCQRARAFKRVERVTGLTLHDQRN